MDEKEEDGTSLMMATHEQAESPSSATLLPSPVASVISLITRSSSLYLRLGSFVGGLALDGARVTTLTGLELSRVIIEGVLSRAGSDVVSRSRGDLGKSEAEGLLERSIATLHSTITQISFAASTGFYFSSAVLSSATDLSQHLLATLDSILGSTDSSRAIASIITLIRREFDNPATGVQGEKVGVADLLVGICGLALLQKWCSRLTVLKIQERNIEEVIWDVVILDDGRKADVVDDDEEVIAETSGDIRSSLPRRMSFMTIDGGDLRTVERGEREESAITEYYENELSDEKLRERIMQSLPSDASVSVTTSITTTKTITVEITGAQPPELLPPPGLEIVEENAHHVGNMDLDGSALTNEQKIGHMVPRYRVVYRTIREKLQGTDITGQGGPAANNSFIIGANDSAISDSEDQFHDLSPTASPDSVQGRFPLLEKSLTKSTNDDDDEEVIPKIKTPTQRICNRHDHGKERGTSSSPLIKPSPIPSGTDTPTDSGTSRVLRPTGSSINNVVTQKRSRKPMSSSSSISSQDTPLAKKVSSSTQKSPISRKPTSEDPMKKPERRGTLRNALKKGSSTALSNIWNKDMPNAERSEKPTLSEKKENKPPTLKPAWGSSKGGPSKDKASQSQLPIPQKGHSLVAAREAPKAPQRGNPNFFSSKDLGLSSSAAIQRSPSRASYYSVHERRRDSLVSQTDMYSVQSNEPNRPSSPTTFRTHLRSQSHITRARSERNMASARPNTPPKNPQSRNSYVPSIYTLNTNDSQASLALVRQTNNPNTDASEATLQSLIRDGNVDGLFPRAHFVQNISRFIRFASASYGSHFMRVMGINKIPRRSSPPGSPIPHHHEHHSFSHHTKLPASTILLSSHVDPQGGTDSSGLTNTGIPMVHYVSLDHKSRAVILTCRGTLGFEDVLTDLTCDYDDLKYRGNTYKVHKGIHASARRILEGAGGRVMATIKAALEEFPDYGLVMCGHSLGGGVTAVLAIMISEPSEGTAFVTASTYSQPQLLLTSASDTNIRAPPTAMQLPAGRPIHVYAYGPPSSISPSLRQATRGLITTIVNNQDLVPYLSLGVLHDLQAVALAFKTDETGAKGEVRKRVWAGLTEGLKDRWYTGENPSSMRGEGEDDAWAYASLKALKASMLSTKLVPPGEVFVVETQRVLKRDAFVKGDEAQGLGRPATRVILKYIRDVEARFGEVRFGGSMLLDHSPGRYELSIGALGHGVLND